MTAPFQATARRTRDWHDPLKVAAGLRDRDGALALLSDGGPLGRWSFVAADPDETRVLPIETLATLDDPAWTRSVVGLIAYDAGARAATGSRPAAWPDLMLARYPSMLAFDHHERRVHALGHGADDRSAEAALAHAETWLTSDADLNLPEPPAESFDAEAADDAYLAAVTDVVSRIAAGDLFQANIARAWSGRLRPEADPFDVLIRLSHRASAFGAFWRLGDRAVVSNSPELFLTFDPSSRRLETRPIKGTRPRADDPERDAELADDLLSSAKDRAENLMIVDLMRNDLSRVAEPGSVVVSRLFEIEHLPTVHHLVSTVTGTAVRTAGPFDILNATFPPGSITGAPKHQAMKVIAAHEPPRGAWCGSLFHLDEAGALTGSVLIRTASFIRSDDGWRFRTLAGAGIVADSDPEAELAETEVKISALRDALAG